MSALDTDLRRWHADRMTLRRDIVLEDGRPFGEVIDAWQEEDFRALDDATHRHAYWERPRGHSKTGDIGTEAVCDLLLGRPGSTYYAVAADADQGALLKEDVAGKFRRTPALRGLVQVTRREVRVRSTGSRLIVLESDVPSAWGLRPDGVYADEVVEWRRRELWDALWSASGKRRHCRVLVITTPGWDRAHFAWGIREHAQREEDWHFSSRGQCASWISTAWLAQQERTLPAHVYARLHLGQWVEGVGAFLTATEVEAVFAEALPAASGPCAIGVDIGLSKDRSVIARVRSDAATGLVVVESVETWAPRPGLKVDLRDVEDAVAALARESGAVVVLDPWQGVLMAQRLRARDVVVEEHAFTGESRRRLFGVLLDLVRTGRLRARPHEELRRELLGLEVHESAAGWRVDHRVGRHDDHVVAVALGALAVAGTDSSMPKIWSMNARVAAPREPTPEEVEELERREEARLWKDAAVWRS